MASVNVLFRQQKFSLKESGFTHSRISTCILSWSQEDVHKHQTCSQIMCLPRATKLSHCQVTHALRCSLATHAVDCEPSPHARWGCPPYSPQTMNGHCPRAPVCGFRPQPLGYSHMSLSVYDTVSQGRVLGDTGRFSICCMHGRKDEGAGREGEGWRDVSRTEFAKLPFKRRFLYC